VNFKPFTLLMKMATPIAMPRHAVHLDALLWSAIGAKYNLEDPGSMHERLSAILDQDQKTGIYKCSAMQCLITPEQGIVQRDMARTDVVHESLNSDYLSTKRKSIVMVGGPTKKRLTPYKTFFAPYVAFHGVGDAMQCAHLIRYYLRGIGKDSMTSGMGEIESIDILDCNDQQEWAILNGMPARNLPEDLAIELKIQKQGEPVSTLPPYWSAAPVSGVRADRLIVRALSEITGA